MTASPTARRSSTCRDLTVLPGLIDTHTHLVGDVQTAGVPATTTSAAQEVLIGVRHAGETIEAGFTTVRDVGTFRAFIDCALRDAIDARRRRRAADAVRRRVHHGAVGRRRRRRPGPRHRRCPRTSGSASFDSVDEVRERVRRLLIGGADLIKCIGTGAVLTRAACPARPS